MKSKFPLFLPITSLVVLVSLPAFADDTPVAGNLNYTGWGKFGDGIDMGANSETSFNWLGSKTTGFDIAEAQGVFLWRDTIVASPASSKNKMQLDGANALSLYKSTGSAGIVLAPETGKITFPAGTGSATGSGIYFGSNTNATLSAASDGSAIFPGQVAFQNGLQLTNGTLSISSATAATSSSTGALTVAGGMGVAMDSWINGVRIGRGAGNMDSNTVLGTDTLSLNVGACWNTAVGTRALYSTVSSYNTAIGFSALWHNTTGTHNTASGMFSLGSNITGCFNTTTGSYSLSSNTTGWFNTASGTYSSASNTTGSFNTASGYNSLLYNGTGEYNTAFGFAAGYSNTTGSSNTFVGSAAGKTQGDGTTALIPNNSIYIGANSRGKNNSDNNSIVIGSNAVGEGANTTVIGSSNTTKAHIYGTLEAGAVTISGCPVVTSIQLSNAVSLSGGSSSGIKSTGMSSGDASAPNATAMSFGSAYGIGSTAMSSAYAGGDYSAAMSFGGANGYASTAMSGGSAEAQCSLASSGGEAQGGYSTAMSAGYSEGYFSTALTLGSAIGDYSVAMSSGTSHGHYSTAMSGGRALGAYSMAAGANASSNSFSSVSFGRYNNTSGNGTSWVETDPLLLVGNGTSSSSTSNAVTTLKNGQTTLTNKAWKADPATTPTTSNSNGEALVVEGNTRLQGNAQVLGNTQLMGKVTIAQPQGDISMGDYQ